MAIDVRQLQTRPLDPLIADELDIFERTLAEYLDGGIEEDVFRVFRLNHGVYGQRQGGRNQMVRVKIPYGNGHTRAARGARYIAETYSRGWGHLTTRQNVQFHFVQLEADARSAAHPRAASGSPPREACGDTVRNVVGCHLAGACPFEKSRHHAVGRGDRPASSSATPTPSACPASSRSTSPAARPTAARPCSTTSASSRSTRERADGTIEPGFQVFVAGGLGANPHPALALEDFTAQEDLLPTIEACLRTFDHYGNRDNKIRARMKWLVDTMGIEELRERILKERKFLRARATGRAVFPSTCSERGDAPAGGTPEITATATARAHAGAGCSSRIRTSGGTRPTSCAASTRARSPRTPTPGSATSRPSSSVRLADIQRDFDLDIRITNRQNFALRDLAEADLRGALRPALGDRHGRAGCRARAGRRLVPGRRHLQPRGHPVAAAWRPPSATRLEDAGLAEVGGVRVNISGCTNSCGQHHISDIGFMGLERRAHGRAAPGYQMLLGGHLGEMEVEFGDKAGKLPAKAAPAAVVEIVGRFASERDAGETFTAWFGCAGGAKDVGDSVKELDNFPAPDIAPDFYVDYDETGPYVAEVGDGECAAT